MFDIEFDVVEEKTLLFKVLNFKEFASTGEKHEFVSREHLPSDPQQTIKFSLITEPHPLNNFTHQTSSYPFTLFVDSSTRAKVDCFTVWQRLNTDTVLHKMKPFQNITINRMATSNFYCDSWLVDGKEAHFRVEFHELRSSSLMELINLSWPCGHSNYRRTFEFIQLTTTWMDSGWILSSRLIARSLRHRNMSCQCTLRYWRRA